VARGSAGDFDVNKILCRKGLINVGFGARFQHGITKLHLRDGTIVAVSAGGQAIVSMAKRLVRPEGVPGRWSSKGGGLDMLLGTVIFAGSLKSGLAPVGSSAAREKYATRFNVFSLRWGATHSFVECAGDAESILIENGRVNLREVVKGSDGQTGTMERLLRPASENGARRSIHSARVAESVRSRTVPTEFRFRHGSLVQ